MIKINSELPNCMLDLNNELNDYDFILFHLYKNNNVYKEYYKQNKSNNRFTILDNSAYEFYVKGEELDVESYVDTICELNPNLYILPDVLMDKEKTLNGVFKFLKEYKDKIESKTDSKPLAVVQGNSEEEFMECLLQYRDNGISNIAIPFHNSFFLDIKPDEYILNDFGSEFGKINKDHKYAMGRIQWVIKNKYILNLFDHVHFLGSHCPLEKVYYKDYQSMDTGYPVKLGMVGEKLFREREKPNIIIDEFIDEELTSQTKMLIIDNVLKFKCL